MSSGEEPWNYAYNARGERVAKSPVNGWTVERGRRFVFDEAGHLLHEAQAAGPCDCVPSPGNECPAVVCYIDYTKSFSKALVGPGTDFVYVDDTPVAVFDATNGLNYLHTDHLGTPRKAFAPNTPNPTWRWDLIGNPFGEQPAVASPLNLNLRFPGQYFDAESGTHYNYFRDYEPGTGDTWRAIRKVYLEISRPLPMREARR